MRPAQITEAHLRRGFAELVCSNSFRSDDLSTMPSGSSMKARRCGSLVLRRPTATKLPAGGALAVDRVRFSNAVTKAVAESSRCHVDSARSAGLPPPGMGQCHRRHRAAHVARALRSHPGAYRRGRARVLRRHRADHPPRLDRHEPRLDPIALRQGWAGRHRRRLPQLPHGSTEYEGFIDALLAGEKTSFKEWEASTPYFDGCLPVEVMAERGRDTLRFGPMKPVGLADPIRGAPGPMRWSSCARTTRSEPYGIWSDSRPS